MTRAKKNANARNNNMRGTANKTIQRTRNNRQNTPPSLEMAMRNSGPVDRTHVEMMSRGSGSLLVKGYEHIIDAIATDGTTVSTRSRDRTAMYWTKAKRLFYIAGAFDYWRPKKVVYHYRPKVGTTVAGRTTLAYDRGMPKTVVDYNTGNRIATDPSKDELLYIQPLVSGPVWQNSRLELDLERVISRKWYSCRPNTFATFDSTDEQVQVTEDGILGTLYTDVSEGDPSLLNKQVGDVWMEYEIELAGPIVPRAKKPITFDCLRGAYLASPAGGGLFQRDNILLNPYRIGLVWGKNKTTGAADGTKLQIGVGYEVVPNSSGPVTDLAWKGPWSGTLTLLRGADTITTTVFNTQGALVETALKTAGYSIPDSSKTDGFINFLVVAPVGKISGILTVEWIDGISYILTSKGIGSLDV